MVCPRKTGCGKGVLTALFRRKSQDGPLGWIVGGEPGDRIATHLGQGRQSERHQERAGGGRGHPGHPRQRTRPRQGRERSPSRGSAKQRRATPGGRASRCPGREAFDPGIGLGWDWVHGNSEGNAAERGWCRQIPEPDRPGVVPCRSDSGRPRCSATDSTACRFLQRCAHARFSGR